MQRKLLHLRNGHDILVLHLRNSAARAGQRKNSDIVTRPHNTLSYLFAALHTKMQNRIPKVYFSIKVCKIQLLHLVVVLPQYTKDLFL